jgi:hypothetical protein
VRGLQIPFLKKFEAEFALFRRSESDFKKNLVILPSAGILAATQKSNERLLHTTLELRGAVENELGRPRRRLKAAI